MAKVLGGKLLQMLILSDVTAVSFLAVRQSLCKVLNNVAEIRG